MLNFSDSNSTAIPSEGGFSPPLAGFLGFLAISVSIITVSGNLLVVTAFFVERALRTPTNYFIASLAVTDLIIGVFSMNFFTLYLLLGSWPLGETFCDLWLSLDYTACLTSQYTVFFITVDRYCSVKIPAKYRNWRTERRLLTMVGATWILPSSIFFTSIMGWPYFTNRVGRRKVSDCYAEFTNYPIFNTILTIGYYWITLVVMCALYAGIYHVALNLQRKSDAKRRNMTTLVTLAGKGPQKTSKTTDDENDDEDDSSGVCCRNDQSAKKIIQRTSNEENATQEMDITPKKSSRRSRFSKKISSTVNYQKTSNKKKKSEEVHMDKERSSSPMLPSDSDNGMAEVPKPKVVQKTNKRSKSKSSAAPETITQSSVHATIESPLVVVDMSPLTKNAVTPSEITDTADFSVSQTVLTGETNYTTMASMEGLKYIDQESLMAIYSDDNVRHMLDAFPPTSINNPNLVAANNTTSPVWKKRDEITFWSEANTAECNAGDLLNAVNAKQQHNDGVNVTDNGVNNREAMNSTTTNVTVVAATKSSLAIPTDISLKPHNQQHHHHHNMSDQTHSNSQQSMLDSERRPVDDDRKTFFQQIQSVKLRFHKRKKLKLKVERGRTENRARKALRTITLILGAFVACWTPYHIFVLVKGFCDDKNYSCINSHIYNLSYWLCYINSPINPFCYALANAQFKKTFLRVLRLDFHRT